MGTVAMMMVAISQRVDHIADYQETRDALDQRWYNLLADCDASPLLIPNHLPHAEYLINLYQPQAMILSGGNQTENRNQVEYAMLDYAIHHKIPVLGVCHGMQMIQRYFGIDLIEVSGHVTPQQIIYVGDKSIEVNSYHRHGTTETNEQLIIWAKAADGVIKAIKHTTLPIYGMMWHPERNQPYNLNDLQFIKNVLTGKLLCEQSY